MKTGTIFSLSLPNTWRKKRERGYGKPEGGGRKCRGVKGALPAHHLPLLPPHPCWQATSCDLPNVDSVLPCRALLSGTDVGCQVEVLPGEQRWEILSALPAPDARVPHSENCTSECHLHWFPGSSWGSQHNCPSASENPIPICPIMSPHMEARGSKFE